MASAKRYTTKMNWHNGDYLAYKAAQKNEDDWFEKCTFHMDAINIIMTPKMCMVSAQNFSTHNEWRTKAPKAYSAALSNGWHDTILQYFNCQLDTVTIDECIHDAASYDRWQEWAKPGNFFYQPAKLRRWQFICRDVIMQKSMKKWFQSKKIGVA